MIVGNVWAVNWVGWFEPRRAIVRVATTNVPTSHGDRENGEGTPGVDSG